MRHVITMADCILKLLLHDDEKLCVELVNKCPTGCPTGEWREWYQVSVKCLHEIGSTSKSEALNSYMMHINVNYRCVGQGLCKQLPGITGPPRH